MAVIPKREGFPGGQINRFPSVVSQRCSSNCVTVTVDPDTAQTKFWITKWMRSFSGQNPALYSWQEQIFVSFPY